MQEATPFSADVIVVGAGLAGLVAADRLRATGLDVTVLEGADRLGGRTYGAHWAAAGREIDLGAPGCSPASPGRVSCSRSSASPATSRPRSRHP